MLLTALVLMACKTPSTDTDPVPTLPVQGTADTATVFTGDTGPDVPLIDCTNLPTAPFPSQRIEGGRAYHGIAFDGLGNMVGSDGSSLVKLSAPGEASLWIPDLSRGEQMEYMADGDLIFSASNGNILRISPDGSRQVISSNVNAYGVIIGPDGFIYTANQSTVHRINPTTGDRTVYVGGVSTPKVINWSPDFTKFYIGTNESNGAIFVVETDPVTLMPLGEPQLFGNTSSTWHDGLGVDACGNVYVAEFWDRRLWRFTPDGDRQLLVQYPAEQYGHGISWGSGIGDWNAMAIYVPQPYDGNRISEAIIGVPDRRFNGGVYDLIE